ncbi:lipase family protein [Paenibacillus humicola]|uniref:lipase family protein n=1 Tax=Paenibacillus humicola TaxID=3110540 RepID=UPI00237B985A|nr:lipase family protein [Paenibacillus humicola]
MRTAIYLAAVCGQAYVQSDNPDGLYLVPAGYRPIGSFEAGAFEIALQPFGFVLESDDAAILAFRGTRSAVDWVTDFIARQIPLSIVRNGGRTHQGFTELYLSARSQIFGLLDRLPERKPLFVTGHSLGGALAVLAALDIASNRRQTPYVYTFGAPRVGDPAFVRTYNKAVKATYRVQNEFDVVPYLPPLVYRSPKTDKTYYYLHVKGEVKRSFRMGSIGGNHVLSSYFADLAKEDPGFAAFICQDPPGLCPVGAG